MIKVYLYLLAMTHPPIGERVIVVKERLAEPIEIVRANKICKKNFNSEVKYIYYNKEANHYRFVCKKEN